MNLQTVRRIAFGAILMASSTSISYVSNATFASTPQIKQHSKNRVIQVAQATRPSTNTMEQAIFKQINQYRVSKGLPAFTRSSKIDSQARVHSQNMASAKVAFGHQNFSDRVKAIGTPYKAAAENVAYNQGYADPATQAVQGWLKSPGHKANIEGKFNQTGIGVAVNSKGEVYFTQLFITTR
jgi:uncharacterized protein YkwD